MPNGIEKLKEPEKSKKNCNRKTKKAKNRKTRKTR